VGRATERVATARPLVVAPVVGVVVAGLAYGFGQAANESPLGVLFSGQDQLPGLIARAGTLSVSTLVLLLAFKGVAYGLSLGAFRGGPTFPAGFLGAAGGRLPARLPGVSPNPGRACGVARLQ